MDDNRDSTMALINLEIASIIDMLEKMKVDPNQPNVQVKIMEYLSLLRGLKQDGINGIKADEPL